ncbi:MAG: SurA N-terminal domain-containing protein [Vicinamibacteria bacterium]
MNPCLRHGRLIVGAIILGVACDKAPASPQASSGSSSDSSVVARVGERKITLGEVDERARMANMAAFQELYGARREALEELVAEALLEQEAKKQGVTSEELQAREIKSRVAEVTSEDVESFYDQNRGRLGGQTLEQIGGQIREFLGARNESLARESYLTTLREGAEIDVSLDPPRAPIQVAEGERIKGSPSAPITIVEYSDFQ